MIVKIGDLVLDYDEKNDWYSWNSALAVDFNHDIENQFDKRYFKHRLHYPDLTPEGGYP